MYFKNDYLFNKETENEILKDVKKDIVITNRTITHDDIKKACKCLYDNGIDEDETLTTLQALFYILFDYEILKA